MKRITAALVFAGLVLSLVPGLPPHGFGHLLFLLPVAAWFRQPERRKRLLLYGAAILLQTLAFPEVDWGFLGFVLLLPYLAARRIEEGAPWWRAALFFGFFRAFAGFQWLGSVHFTAWAATALGSGFLFASIFEAGVRRLRFLPFSFRVALSWTAFEWFHSWFCGGLPWLYLAHTQYRFLPFIQSADLFGAWGISFLVALLQAAAFQAAVERRFAPLAVALLLAAANLAYGLRPPPSDEPPGPEVLLVQSRYTHDVKSHDEPEADALFEDLRDLTDRGLAAHPETRLVVWPETLYPYPLIEKDLLDRFGFAVSTFENAQRYARPFIYGVNSFTEDSKLIANRGHNSAVLVDAGGHLRGIYRKQRLVPMGELFLPRLFLPESFCDAWVGWMMERGYPVQCDLETGKGHVTLDGGPGLRCAMLICFEGLYPDLTRKALEEGSPDFILHLANHGWFGRSWAQAQAVASWVFRAIESRTPFLSCANAGLTCAVAPDGRLLGSIPEPLARGSLFVRVPLRGPRPPFLRGARHAFPALLGLVSALFLAASRLRRNRLDSGKAFC